MSTSSIMLLWVDKTADENQTIRGSSVLYTQQEIIVIESTDKWTVKRLKRDSGLVSVQGKYFNGIPNEIHHHYSLLNCKLPIDCNSGQPSSRIYLHVLC